MVDVGGHKNQAKPYSILKDISWPCLRTTEKAFETRTENHSHFILVMWLGYLERVVLIKTVTYNKITFTYRYMVF
jgi:hypothetical protein